MANPIIDLQDIDVTFKQGKEVVHAVKDVSATPGPGNRPSCGLSTSCKSRLMAP